ncbi:hypothetical protein BH10PSE1_BH10PSE1_11190 [soil metagenome]
MEPIVVSLGGWCRPAWQARRVLGGEAAFPFDWQITSFAALLHILSPDYRPENALVPENCGPNRFGSVTDAASGWIFQHDLEHSLLDLTPDGQGIDWTERSLATLAQTREKFAFLDRRFRETCRDNPLTFIRWLRTHPDREWPGAFEGEDPEKLLSSLRSLAGHDDVRIVYVTTVEVEGPNAESGFEVEPASYGFSVVLHEALKNFFAPNHWTGDSEAWDLLIPAIRDGFAQASQPDKASVTVG